MVNSAAVSLAAGILVLWLTSPLAAQNPAAGGGNIAEFVAAVTKSPAMTAAKARADAAQARLGSAGRFPDPEVEGMYSRKTTTMPDETMPMWEVNLRQPLPKAGERAADRDRAKAVVAMAEAEFAAMAGEMAADIAMSLAEADTAKRRLEALTEQLTRTQQVLSAVEVRIGTGQGRLSDRLALQTQIAAMQLMVERDRRMADDAISEARGLLGIGPEAPLPVFTAPQTSDIDVNAAPIFTIAAAKGDEAKAMGRMARASARPMTAVGLRFEREKAAMGNNDTLGVAFMTELPWRGRRYARADERAARSEAAAAQADADGARHRIVAALARVARAERLADLSQRLAGETKQRLSADYDTLVRSAGTGSMGTESSVLMILEVLEKTTDAELQRIDAEGAAQVARAELWRYASVLLFSRS